MFGILSQIEHPRRCKLRYFLSRGQYTEGVGTYMGFTTKMDIVDLVQKKTYVECTKYVRRNTPATASSRQPQTTNKRTMAVASGFCGF
jgi:hypothetical protein